jgi:hypothetical protein
MQGYHLVIIIGMAALGQLLQLLGGSGSFGASFLRGSRSSAQTSGLTNGGTVVFNQVDNSAGQEMSLNTSTGQITLAAGRTYRLMAQVPNFQTTSGETRLQLAWYNETSGAYIGSSSSSYPPLSGAAFGTTGGLSEAIITTTTSTVVSYRIIQITTASQLGGNSDFNLTGSFPWFEAQVISGNAPVTGQSVDYIQASLSANQALSAVGNINFNTSSGTGITITSGGFNLIANKTYKLEAAIGGASVGYAYFGWVDNSNNLLPGGSIGAVIKAGNVHTDAPQDKAVVYFTPTVDTRVFLRVYNLSGTLTAYAPSLSTNFSSTWASIQQVGSSAFVNPWTLSGTNTYNTTGNVGIGSSSPTEKLEVSGNVKATNFVGGETPIYLSANKASSQSIPYNAETIITNWDGAGWFNNFPSAWNSTTGAWTCPRAGVYEFFFSAMLASHSGSGIGNEFAVILSLNGSLQSVGDFWAQTTSTTRTPHASTNLIMSLNVGDVVTTRIYQNLTGNAISTQAGRLYFQIKQLPSRINIQ